MSEPVKYIQYGFHAGNLFTDDEGYDVEASAAAYAQAVKEALQKSYPEAEIVVNYDFNVGASQFGLYTEVNDWRGHPDVDVIDHIADQVYDTFEWVVAKPSEKEETA